MVSDGNKPTDPWCWLCCTHAGQHLSEQLARKEPTVLTAAAGVATAHYTSIRWSEGSSVSLLQRGQGALAEVRPSGRRHASDLLPRHRWLRIKPYPSECESA